MDDQRNGTDKMDEIMLPGFRFHPTDEELVGFYLKRKVQQRPLPIELIKQLDIYKYNPWDLPKLAATGEKEWYFYCPRDRKYRNSTRPNRVTGAGFWKATGTDRPIYPSEGSKCIGLKKSLVFYKGRAAKGIKTEWMMHEFRLPSLADHPVPQTRPFMDKSIPAANDSWAICRIFKKTNSSTAQRAVSQYSWMSPVPETLTTSDILSQQGPLSSHQFTSSENIQFSSNHHHDLQQSCITSFSPPFVPHKPLISISNGELPTSLGYAFSSLETPSPGPSKCAAVDASSMSLNMSSTIFGDFGKTSESVDHFSGLQEQCDGFSVTLPQEMHANASLRGEETALFRNLNGAHFEEQWGTTRSSTGIPFITSSPLIMADAWKSNLAWDSSSPCPSDQTSTSYSANKCYN